MSAFELFPVSGLSPSAHEQKENSITTARKNETVFLKCCFFIIISVVNIPNVFILGNDVFIYRDLLTKVYNAV